MTAKQKLICYYKVAGYTPRQCSLIVGVSDNYTRKVLGNTEEIDLEGFWPPYECQARRRVLDHIMETAGYAFIPRQEKYGYISLLAYIGFDYPTIRSMFAEDETSFLYMAIYRSNKAWKEFDSEYIGVSHTDYADLMQIRHYSKL